MTKTEIKAIAYDTIADVSYDWPSDDAVGFMRYTEGIGDLVTRLENRLAEADDLADKRITVDIEAPTCDGNRR